MWRAYDKNPEIEKCRHNHTNAMKKVKAKKRTPFVAPHDKVAEKAGYIVWKDKKLLFFTLMTWHHRHRFQLLMDQNRKHDQQCMVWRYFPGGLEKKFP